MPKYFVSMYLCVNFDECVIDAVLINEYFIFYLIDRATSNITVISLAGERFKNLIKILNSL